MIACDICKSRIEPSHSRASTGYLVELDGVSIPLKVELKSGEMCRKCFERLIKAFEEMFCKEKSQK